MIKITLADVDTILTNALESGKKNILLISSAAKYDCVLNWHRKHPEYYLCRAVPTAIYEEKDGRLTKNEDCMVIDNKSLEKANSKKSVWFHHAFSEQSVYNFEGFSDIIKNRYYINKFPDGESVKFSLENMAMFIAFTAPYSENDWSALGEKYYDLFDEIYFIG